MQSRRKVAARWLALAAVIAMFGIPGAARADTVTADGDLVTPGPQPVLDLGAVLPSTQITLEVPFSLVCTNGSHIDPGQVVTLDYVGGIQPVGGEIVSASGGTTAAAPADWTPDGVTCPVPAPTLDGGNPADVVLLAPADDGANLEFLLTWSRSVAPAGGGDSRALTGAPSLTVRLDVVSNTPPVVSVPATLTVEADTVGGWVADWDDVVSVSDAEDDPDPSALCDAAPGSTLPLGTTPVTCSATDEDGASGQASIDVEVVDTTAPSLAGVASVRLETPDLAGATVSYAVPAAVDVADPAPTLACVPVSGTTFAVGTTTVTCTATDASGNVGTTSFGVEVVHVPLPVVTAIWGEPVGVTDGGTFTANRGRTVPVKVVLAVDRVVRSTGVARLRIEGCGSSSSATLPLTFGGGRWNASIDTAILAAGCHTVTATIDGLDAGRFRLDLRGSEAGMTKAKGR